MLQMQSIISIARARAPAPHQTPLITHQHHPSALCTSMASRKLRAMRMGEGNISLSGNRSLRSVIKCMANERRVKMVGKQIRRELSAMLLSDNVLQFAVLPEAALGADRYLSCLTTITHVQVSSDLQVAKVYVSVFGDERGKDVAISGLKSKAKYVRSELGRRMKLRLTPEIRFIEDESIERGSRVIAILDRLKDEKTVVESPDDRDQSSDLTEDNSSWDGDDPDEEGIIYVK